MAFVTMAFGHNGSTKKNLSNKWLHPTLKLRHLEYALQCLLTELSNINMGYSIVLVQEPSFQTSQVQLFCSC